MSAPKDSAYSALWAEDLEEVDREIARLATICQVRILEPGVVRRVLNKDPSVCEAPNPVAFAKLHDVLMLHLAVREKSAETLGQAQTAKLEDQIIERLVKAYPDLAAPWPPAS
jgi:hypothetical protein